MSVEERQDALEAARLSLVRLEDARTQYRVEQTEAFQERLKFDCDLLWGKEIKMAQHAVALAQDEYYAALMVEAKAKYASIVGKRMEEWSPKSVYGPAIKTGRVGIIEIFGPGSRLDATVVYSLPEFGDPVIRILKRDGRPSKRIVRAERWPENGEVTFRGWKPE